MIKLFDQCNPEISARMFHDDCNGRAVKGQFNLPAVCVNPHMPYP